MGGWLCSRGESRVLTSRGTVTTIVHYGTEPVSGTRRVKITEIRSVERNRVRESEEEVIAGVSKGSRGEPHQQNPHLSERSELHIVRHVSI